MDIDRQLGELEPLLTGVVGRIDPRDLDRSTPCTEFSVRGVLEHMIGGATAFAAAFRDEPAGEADTTDVLGNFPPVLGELFHAILAPGALGKTVASPFGPMPGDMFARLVVLDGLVHGWDLATATGQDYEPSEELVKTVTEFAENVLPGARGTGAFGDAVTPPDDASPIERLAALTGRTV